MLLLQKTHIILYSSMTIFFYIKRQPLSLPQQSPPGGVMGLANWTVYGSGPVPLLPPGGGIIPFSTFVVSVRTCPLYEDVASECRQQSPRWGGIVPFSLFVVSVSRHGRHINLSNRYPYKCHGEEFCKRTIRWPSSAWAVFSPERAG